MEPRERVAKAKNATIRTNRSDREQANKRRHEFNKTRVKIMTDEVKGNTRFEDIDVIDEILEKQETLKRISEPFRLLRIDEEIEKDDQVVVKALQGDEDYVIETENEKMELDDGSAEKLNVLEKEEEKHKQKEELIQLLRVANEKDEDNQVDVNELLVDGHFYSYNIDTETGYKSMEIDEVSYAKHLPKNGLFKDARRRIDYVMVVVDDRIPLMQAIRSDFLTNLLKTGLELEFEEGVMKEHKNLIFIKVHAADKVLEAYADTFGMKKYFLDEHLEFIKSKYSLMDWFFTFRHEREWLKLVRRQYIKPLKYSNLQRSYIVFMMLQHLRFGKPNNYYSLARLLKNRIILDAYALHDGPYFFHPKQESAYINARQILFYNWIGSLNIFTFQPLNLINEYFGPKIAFYFAFYEFYNKALFIPIVLGPLIVLNQYIDFATKTEDSSLVYPENKIKRESDIACKPIGQTKKEYDEFYMCPKCRNFEDCPFLKLKDYCTGMYYKTFFDNEITIYYSFFICILVILFIRFWKRTENYWIWMWELGLPPKRSTIRCEYTVPYRNPSRSQRTGIWVHHDDASHNICRYLISNLAMFLCGLGVLVFAASMIWLNNFLLKKFSKLLIRKKWYPEYVIIAVVATVGVIGSFICERICWIISHKVTNIENHRTHENFESSHILKVFGCSFAYTFPNLIYLALIKGAFYVTPIHNYSPKLNITGPGNLKLASNVKLDWLGDLFITNCGYYLDCWDEVAMFFTATMISKLIVTQVFKYCLCLPTDYSKGVTINMTVPSWEREYMLGSITEEDIVLKMNVLMIQISLLALFGFTNGLIPVLVFFLNILDMRKEAKVMLLNSRRPLLYRCVGIGRWNYVLYFIVYAATITMSIMLVKSSSPIERIVEDNLTTYKYDAQRDLSKELPNLLLTKRFVEFETMHYDGIKSAKISLSKYKKKPKKCHFGGSFNDHKWITSGKLKEKVYGGGSKWPHPELDIYYPGDLRESERLHKKRMIKGGFFIAYIHMVALVFLVVIYNIPTISKTTNETKEKERNLLRMHLENIKIDKKHRVGLIAE